MGCWRMKRVVGLIAKLVPSANVTVSDATVCTRPLTRVAGFAGPEGAVPPGAGGAVGTDDAGGVTLAPSGAGVPAAGALAASDCAGRPGVVDAVAEPHAAVTSTTAPHTLAPVAAMAR
jgi:hypothetical protein